MDEKKYFQENYGQDNIADAHIEHMKSEQEIEEKAKRIFDFISFYLGDYKTVHIGNPIEVLNTQFIAKSTIQNLSKELASFV